jgi:predicted nucleic acid-binding protein
MGTLVLIDSNVFIGALKLDHDPIREITRRVELHNVVCCGVVKAEVLRGIKVPKFRNQFESFFSLTQMVPTTASLWDEVWQLAWKLDRQGKVLPLQDIVIACCANRAGAAVMTTDRHFDLIDGLTVIRP